MSKPNPAEIRLMYRICWLYYIDGKSQGEIAAHLGLTRLKVNRLIKQARKTGAVQVSIRSPFGANSELEAKLCERFGLKDSVIVMDANPKDDTYRWLMEGVSDWLISHFKPEIRVGLHLGRTLSHLPLSFDPPQKMPCKFIEVIGSGYGRSDVFGPYNVTSRMAEIAGGEAVYLNAPTVVSNKEVRKLIIAEPPIAQALEQARKCDVILQSVGIVDDSALLFLHGFLSAEEVQALKQSGAVGDVLGQFINIDGDIVPNPVEERIVSISLDDLKKTPFSVVIFNNIKKVPVVKAALKKGLFNVVITDTQSAQKMLEE